MNQAVRQEIRENEEILESARNNILDAWIAGDKRVQSNWVHYADMIDARLSYLRSIANKGA